MSTNSIRSIRIEPAEIGPGPDGNTYAVIVAARSDHGDTEFTTRDGYVVNTGSYVHVDDVADYLALRAGLLVPTDAGRHMADMLHSIAMTIRTAGV